MNILLLPNSFKGSLSARQTARVLQQALSKKHRVKSFPLSDGGDGFIDFFMGKFHAARTVRLRAQNAFGQTVICGYPNKKPPSWKRPAFADSASLKKQI